MKISATAQNRWSSLQKLDSILDLNKGNATVLSLHSAQALGKILKSLTKRGMIGFEFGEINDKPAQRLPGTINGLVN